MVYDPFSETGKKGSQIDLKKKKRYFSKLSSQTPFWNFGYAFVCNDSGPRGSSTPISDDHCDWGRRDAEEEEEAEYVDDGYLQGGSGKNRN